MPATAKKQQMYTTSDVADIVGKTGSRIRQICRDYEIGRLVEGRVRLLSRRDLRRIEKILEKIGRNFESRY